MKGRNQILHTRIVNAVAYDTVMKRLFTLPQETKMYPAHLACSNIESSQRTQQSGE